MKVGTSRLVTVPTKTKNILNLVLFFCFQVTFFATSYVIPLALICGLYLRMLIRLWSGAVPGGHVSAEGRRGRKRATRMVVVVVAIFASCWCPIQVSLIVLLLRPCFLHYIPYLINQTLFGEYFSVNNFFPLQVPKLYDAKIFSILLNQFVITMELSV